MRIVGDFQLVRPSMKDGRYLKCIDTFDGKAEWSDLPLGPARVSSLPGTPVDGQELYYQSSAMATDGLIWHLRYRTAATGSYKWEFVGGAPIYAEQMTTGGSTNSTTYADLTVAGPSLVIPLSGDYIIEHGARIWNNTAGMWCAMSYSTPTVAAVDADWIVPVAGANQSFNLARRRRKNGLISGTVAAKFRVNGGGGFAEERWISALPIRVT